MSRLLIFLGWCSLPARRKLPLIGQFFSRAKEIGHLCDEIRADVTAKLVKDFSLDESEFLNGSLDLEKVFSLVSMDGEMRSLLKQEVVRGAAEFDAAFLRRRSESLSMNC